MIDRYRSRETPKISSRATPPRLERPAASGRVRSIVDRDANLRGWNSPRRRGYLCEQPWFRRDRYCWGFGNRNLWWSAYAWTTPRFCGWLPGYSFLWDSYWTWPWVDTWYFGHSSSFYFASAPYACYATSLPATWVDTTPVVIEAEPPVEAARPAAPAMPLADRSTEVTLATYYIELADLYFKTRSYARAAAAYARAVKLVPEDGSLRLVLADAWIAVGDYEQAAYSIRRAFELDPELASISIDKSAAYGKVEDFEKHVDAMRRRVVEEPTDLAARLCLAVTLRSGPDAAEARMQLERLAELAPSDETAKLLLAR